MHDLGCDMTSTMRLETAWHHAQETYDKDLVTVKRQQSVWVAAPSDEVHLTQGLLEVWQELPRTGQSRRTKESRGVQSFQD